MGNGSHLRWPPRQVTASSCMQDAIQQLRAKQAILRAACLGSERQCTCLLNLLNLIWKWIVKGKEWVVLASSQRGKKQGRGNTFLAPSLKSCLRSGHVLPRWAAQGTLFQCDNVSHVESMLDWLPPALPSPAPSIYIPWSNTCSRNLNNWVSVQSISPQTPARSLQGPMLCTRWWPWMCEQRCGGLRDDSGCSDPEALETVLIA